MRRTLYQNDSDGIFKGQRAIILNGIGKLVEREDILDRSLILTTQRIPEEKRKTEAAIFSRLREMKPYLLHKIFTALTKVISIYPTISLESSHRMADFEALGYAICEALDGYSGTEWLDVYDKVVKRQVDTALEESATAQIAKYLVDGSAGHYWIGTATDMRKFNFRDDDHYIENDADNNIKDQVRENLSFPRSASALGVQLNRAESTLMALGITIDHIVKDGKRLITLKDVNKYNPDEKPEKLKFVVYTRKSTEGAERQVASIPDQKNYANKVVARFEESASASKVNNRPQFNKMIKMIEDGEANAIVCWYTNRLSRNPQENGLIQQMLLDGKIKMIHTHDAIHKQGDSIISLGVEASLNAEYSKKLSEDVTRGILSKNKRGEFNSVAPQGYLNARDKLTKKPIIVKDPERFHLIKKMFNLYLTGAYTVPELLDILNNDWGHRTKKRLKSGGTPLRLTSLHNILGNPFYMGKVRDMEDPSILHDGA